MTTTATAHLTTPRIVRTVTDLRRVVDGLREAGSPVALVPTMGAFHDGHLGLMRRAAADGHSVVVSLFVNPTQFAPTEDLAAYPRDERRDIALAGQAGVDTVFAPDADEMYPAGFATTVTVGGPSLPLEGAARPDHFAGVTTVVAKLLIAARPDRVVFGQKDAQQVAVLRRLVRDLHLDDVDFDVAPIAREADGLAMSSRNAYLGPEDRAAATVLRRSLDAALAAVRAGERDPRAVERIARGVLSAEPRCAPEYADIVDPDTFHPCGAIRGPVLLCVAARVGPARLIDNEFLTTDTH